MKKVKETIHEKVENVPPPELMRIREFANKRLTKIYLDTKTLGKNAGGSILDFKQICCQRTSKPETIDKDSIMLYVARWHPETLDYSTPQEMSFSKHCLITDLKKDLSSLSGIPLEHIRVEHPRPFLLKNEHKKRICILDWDGSKLIASSTLGSKPWSLRSGDHIFYKDNREKEKYSKDDFAENIMLKMEFEEQPLIIYDPLEQMLREEEENKKLTEQKRKI